MSKDDEILTNIGTRIRKIRESKRLTQTEVASKMEVRPNQYGLVENGKVLPSLKTLVKVAQALNVTTDELIFGKKPIETVEVQDQELAKKMNVISELEPADKYVATEIIDLILAKKTLKELASKFSGTHPSFE